MFRAPRTPIINRAGRRPETSYRRAFTPAEAVACIANQRHLWHPVVLDAFLRETGLSVPRDVAVA
jgi:hypothetical protein